MSRKHAENWKVPDNPTWMEFPRSDGDPKQLPKNTTKVVTGGQVNYMRPVDIDESLSVNWRIQVARAVATRMGLPGKH